MSDINVPDDAEDWPIVAKAAVICECNKAEELREEIDGLVGIPNPQWKETKMGPASFTKYEKAMLVLALGGPQ